MRFCIIALLFITGVKSLNILSIFPYHGKSHFLVLKVLLQELARRGHNVTVISHFPEEIPPENYHDVSLAGTIKIWEDEAVPLERTYATIMSIGKYIFDSGVLNCDVMMRNDEVQDLMKKKPKFDLVIMEQFNTDCGLGIAYALQAPVVGVTTSVLMPYHYERLGIPANPSFVSYHFLEGGTKPSLYQKIERFFIDFIFKIGYSMTQRSNYDTLIKYVKDMPQLEELARDIKFMLVYHNFVLTGSRLNPSNVIEVAGFHVTEAKPVTGDLKKFIEEAKDGVIYISFGSVVKGSSLPPEKVQMIIKVMEEFPQRFIWKWEDKTLLLEKDKLYVASWLPQIDILGHPKTLAFFSHAGMGGTSEAWHFGVPMIAMPILGDQPSNAAAIEESGFGVQLQYRDLNKNQLVAALKKVLDPEFRANAKRLSAAFHDRPMPPLDTAVFWIEYAARHSNFTFRTAAADVTTYQYYNLDVIFVVTVTFVCFNSLLFICLRSCVKRGSQKVKRS